MKFETFLITVLKNTSCRKYAVKVDLLKAGLGASCLVGPGKKANRIKLFNMLPEYLRNDAALVSVDLLDGFISY